MKQFYILSLLLTFNFTFSQVYFEDDFDGSGPGLAGWTLVNNDGLTPHANVGIFTDAWIEADVFTNAGDVVAKSTSWYDPAGTADDWMITPAIILTDDATLSWDAEGENEDYLDGYEVRLSTQTTNLVDFTTILYSTTAANDVWTNRSIDLNTYTGSTVYIAWRNNSTDKYVLRINNVKVEATIARIVIGTTSLATSAALDVTSTDKGLLVPRMNTVQRTGISNPATGLLVFDTNTLSFWFYNGIGSWQNMKPEYDNLGDLIATQNLKLSSNWLSRDDNNEGVFVDPEGNVGIGITTLNTKLHVVGKTIIDGSTMEFANIGNSVFIGELTGFNDNYSNNHNTGIGYRALQANISGSYNTAVGGFSLRRSFDNYNTAVGMYSLYNDTNDNTGNRNTGIGRGTLTNNINGDQNTCLGNFANVGIGNLKNATAIGANAYVTQSNSLILGSINGVNSATADTKVGIGTTAPNYDLDVRGDVYASSNFLVGNTSGTGTIPFRLDGHNNKLYLVAESNDSDGPPEGTEIRLRTASGDNTAVDRVTIDKDGFVGIGITDPIRNLDVVGEAFKTTGSFWDNTSDMRLKENVHSYERGLNEILQINPIYFTYKEESGLKNPEEYGSNIGISAQELQQIIPEAVSVKAVTLQDGIVIEDALHLTKADAMWFALINVVKERQEIIDAQQSEIDTMKAQNEALKSKVDEVDVLKAEMEAIKAMMGMNNKLVKK